MGQSQWLAQVFDTIAVMTAISIFSFSATQIASSNRSVYLDMTITRNSIRIQTTINGDQQNTFAPRHFKR